MQVWMAFQLLVPGRGHGNIFQTIDNTSPCTGKFDCGIFKPWAFSCTSVTNDSRILEICNGWTIHDRVWTTLDANERIPYYMGFCFHEREILQSYPSSRESKPYRPGKINAFFSFLQGKSVAESNGTMSCTKNQNNFSFPSGICLPHKHPFRD